MKRKAAKKRPAKRKVVKKKTAKRKPVKRKRKARPVGRPRAITPDLELKILSFIEGGGSRVKAAQHVGICPTTITNEANANPKFMDSLMRAEAACYTAQVRKITGADDWRAAGWFLARRYSEEFSEVQKVAQTDVQGRDLTPEQRRRAINAKLRADGYESTTTD